MIELARFISERRFAIGITLAWLIAIAVFYAGSARANERVDIPVPRNVIYAGQMIDSSLLKPRSVPASYPARASVFVTIDGLVGMVARTTLMPGRPIAVNQVVEPDVVRVNRPAIMRFVSHGLTITSEVLPLNSAKSGALVRARNIHSGAIVTGYAMADGSIQAGLGGSTVAPQTSHAQNYGRTYRVTQ